MSNTAIINGVEYPTLAAGCAATGLNYPYARLKAMKSDKFEMNQVAKVEIIRKTKKEKRS